MMNDSNRDANSLPLPKPAALPKLGFPQPASAQPTQDDRSDPTQIRESTTPARKPTSQSESRFDATFLNEVLEKAEDFVAESHASGRYEVLRLIARGGMGEVWLAKDRKVGGRHVALKRLTRESLNSDKLRQRFEAESLSMAKLRHTHTIQVIDVGADEHGPYICMEYIPGPKRLQDDWSPDLPAPPLTLQDYIDTSGALTSSEACRLLLKLCGAVQEAHSLQVIHRDIKPANVLMNEQLEPKLIDFGLARDMRPEESQHTVAGAQMLTIGYGAPEQEKDASDADERADVYALGAVLWFLVSGKNPRYYRSHDAPAELQGLLLDALASERDKRIQSVADLVSRLKPVASIESAWLADDSRGKAPIDDITALIHTVKRDRKPGVCPYCEHVHTPVPESAEQRRCCGGCGIPIWRTCDSCQARKASKKTTKATSTKYFAIWERCCSQCGGDLFEATLTSLTQVSHLMAQAKVALREQPHTADRVIRETQQTLDVVVNDCGLEKATGNVHAILGRLNADINHLMLQAGTKSVESAEREWEIAFAAYTPYAFEQYLKKYPQGIHAESALKHLEIASLLNEVVNRIGNKQLKGLLPILDTLIGLDPSVRANWPEEKAAKLLANDKTCESSLAYLSLYPSGKAAKHARAIAAVELRERLMQRMGDAKLRMRYLDCRQDDQLAVDTSRAWTWMLVDWIVVAVIIAVIAFFRFAPIVSREIVSITIIGSGLIIGLAFCSFSHHWAKVGPLPALSYLLPPSWTRVSADK